MASSRRRRRQSKPEQRPDQNPDPECIDMPMYLWLSIFLQMSVDGLLRMANTCRLWMKNIINHAFLVEHAKVIASQDGERKIISLPTIRRSDTRNGLFHMLSSNSFEVLMSNYYHWVINPSLLIPSCNNSLYGILCVSDSKKLTEFGKRAYLFNPYIQRILPLCESSFLRELRSKYSRHVLSFVGFAFCKSANDFKVVRLHYLHHPKNPKILLRKVPSLVEAYSLNSKSWSKIECTDVPCIPSQSSVSTPDGVIFWLADKECLGDNNRIMSFDVHTNIYKEIQLPKDCNSWFGGNILISPEGFPAFFVHHGIENNGNIHHYTVWDLEDYKGEAKTWIKRFTVKKTCMVQRAFGFTENGKFLMEGSDRRLCSWDPVDGCEEDLVIDVHEKYVDAAYSQSLILLGNGFNIITQANYDNIFRSLDS